MPRPRRPLSPCQLRRPGCIGHAEPRCRGCPPCQRDLLREMKESGYLDEVPSHTNHRRAQTREDVRETRRGPIDPTETS